MSIKSHSFDTVFGHIKCYKYKEAGATCNVEHEMFKLGLASYFSSMPLINVGKFTNRSSAGLSNNVFHIACRSPRQAIAYVCRDS